LNVLGSEVVAIIITIIPPLARVPFTMIEMFSEWDAWLKVVVVLVLILYFSSLPLMYHARLLIQIALPAKLGLTKASCKQGVRTTGVVLLDDLDINMHMNNSSYAKNADFGRVKFYLDTGLLALARKQGWILANGGVYFQFKREMRLFQRYTVVTRLHSWDEKWMWIEHRYQTNGKDFAVGFFKSVVKTKKREDVLPVTVLKLLGQQQSGFSEEQLDQTPGTHVAATLEQQLEQLSLPDAGRVFGVCVKSLEALLQASPS